VVTFISVTFNLRRLKKHKTKKFSMAILKMVFVDP